jgi:hypothetical protein
VLACALACSTAADAALQTITGTSFDVVYDDAALGLFGTPGLAGNTLFFTRSAFQAQSLNGALTDLETSTINVQLVAKNGFQFGGLQLVERGDYRLDGAGSSVSVGGQLGAFDPNDAVNTYSFSFIQASPGTPLNLNDNTLKPWIAGASLDVSAAPFDVPTTLYVTIQNQLTATTQAGVEPSLAFIQKKFTAAPITLEVVAVPAPASLPLVATGLIGPFGSLVRRRR